MFTGGNVNIGQIKGMIFSIQRFSTYDGPGIRTTVFLKGCPLRCLWCQNPESQSSLPEIALEKEKCIECLSKKCLTVCPTGPIRLEPGGRFIIVDRKLCNLCMKCVNVCSEGALKIIGQTVTVDDVVKEVLKDAPFYRTSSGGVTLSGGEPLAQPLFSRELLRKCKENDIHTVLDTAGYADWVIFRKVLEYVDLVLYDIKHMDPLKHEEFTGVRNELILKNAERIASENIPMIIRVPLIPGYTATKENIEAIKRFVSKLKGVEEIDLIPYNPLAEYKYEILGREYKLRGLEPPEHNQVLEFKKILEDEFKVVVVGW